MKKVFKAKGLTVTVTTMAPKRYLVEILILKESLEKEICIKNNQFYFRMSTTKFLKDQMVIKLQKEYKTDLDGNITGINDATKLKFSGDGYKGSIVLYPKSYIPKGMRKKTKKDEGYSKVKLTEKPKEPSSKYVNYAHNNAAKPFIGGKVSPK